MQNIFSIQRCSFCCLASITSLTTSKLRLNEKEIADMNLPIATRYLYSNVSSENKGHKYHRVNSLESDNHAQKSSNHDEIIALFRRIQMSISEESPAVSRWNSLKKSEQKNSKKLVLENQQKQGKMEATKEFDDEEEEETEVDKTSRPKSKFIKRSPIQTSNAEKAMEEQPMEYSANASLEMQQLNKMKLAELKVLARTQGIKGYSRLKKGELLELLKEV